MGRSWQQGDSDKAIEEVWELEPRQGGRVTEKKGAH